MYHIFVTAKTEILSLLMYLLNIYNYDAVRNVLSGTDTANPDISPIIQYALMAMDRDALEEELRTAWHSRHETQVAAEKPSNKRARDEHLAFGGKTNVKRRAGGSSESDNDSKQDDSDMDEIGDEEENKRDREAEATAEDIVNTDDEEEEDEEEETSDDTDFISDNDDDEYQEQSEDSEYEDSEYDETSGSEDSEEESEEDDCNFDGNE